MKEITTKLLNTLGWAYWIKITTATPVCTYYFGPFLSRKEANTAKPGFIEDLKEEGATGIKVELERCKPKELTIFNDLGENQEFQQAFSMFSRQL
ncbi:MAG: DUF1816 domain-containing protein [Pleurocapsa sp.]